MDGELPVRGHGGDLRLRGVANGPALPGTACNDGDPNTGNDTWDANCNCVGQLIDCEGTRVALLSRYVLQRR